MAAENTTPPPILASFCSSPKKRLKKPRSLPLMIATLATR
ncbi:hypothetical protein KO116_03364 [Halomonas sp. KO116]|nr:hypothetical protein KO116_03364 [Halomonas sp. KO116]